MKVILVEVENPGNVGAVARVMKNLGFSDLILVNPKCDYRDSEARKRAKHAQDILDNACVVSSLASLSLTLVGTTSLQGSETNILRHFVTPETFSQKELTMVGLVFGRESQGLTNDELDVCSYTITIPTSQEYPSLNLSHAVTILLYLASQSQKRDNKNIISPDEKRILLSLIDDILQQMHWITLTRYETQRKMFHRFIGKQDVTRMEFRCLCSFFKKVRITQEKTKSSRDQSKKAIN